MSAEQSSGKAEPQASQPLSGAAGQAGAASATGKHKKATIARLGPVGLIVLVLVISGLGMFWSVQPKPFSVKENLTEMIGSDAIAGSAAPASKVPGTAVVATQIRVAQTMLHKPGGYLRNDMLPPGVLMDNMPNWEFGVLTELRDSVRSLRNDFTRSQSQSIESPLLQRADSDFNFDSEAWFLPSAEEMYVDGVDNLQQFLKALVSGNDNSARFYARADNLRAYLEVVEKRLGSYGQRLAASVGDPELTAAIEGQQSNAAGEATEAKAMTAEATPWTQIDDVFYEARGYAWALLHMMKAVRIDFAQVLQQKNAEISMEQILRDLEQAVVRKYSPMVLNGHGFGVLANHSLVLASYLGRTNAAIIDLRVLLERG
ncbi:MAG: DUF2333 family protein [Gammaproteobacteria bacterium]|jgi:hypothetical protein|nr:DUF2333 family protein [Gammaproteobacteria bacterium]